MNLSPSLGESQRMDCQPSKEDSCRIRLRVYALDKPAVVSGDITVLIGVLRGALVKVEAVGREVVIQGFDPAAGIHVPAIGSLYAATHVVQRSGKPGPPSTSRRRPAW